MKKTVSLSLIVSMLICMLMLSACESKSEVCLHSYGLIKTEAGCLQGGISTYKCSLCGDTYEKYESALGHTTFEGTCSRCGANFGAWEISFYVDEFNNPTNQAYMRTSDILYGTFSNSATTDSTLYARILIDPENITIKLWEYGSNEVNAYTATDYKVTILDDNSQKHYTTGTMYKNGNRIYLADWTLINLLTDNKELKIYIQEDSKYGVNSTYLFSVKSGNFNSIYYDFYHKYMK